MASESIAPFTPQAIAKATVAASQRSEELDSIAKGAISSHVQAFAEIRLAKNQPLEAPPLRMAKPRQGVTNGT